MLLGKRQQSVLSATRKRARRLVKAGVTMKRWGRAQPRSAARRDHNRESVLLSNLSPPLAELMVGCVRVLVRYGCVRRDQYELLTPHALPAALRQQLAHQGTLRGSDVLYTVDVPARHQITVAPAKGRIVVMPRLQLERAAQRQHALALAALVSELCQQERG